MSKKLESLKIAVKCRPLNSAEISCCRESIVTIDTKNAEVIIENPKLDPNKPPKTFTFDFTYSDNSSQEEIYSNTAYPIVKSVLEGYNGTIFAYGQTGAGKTFTMEGLESSDQKGIIPRAFNQIFEEVKQQSQTKFLIWVSFLEIYNEKIHDLLSKNPKSSLDIKENAEGVFFVKNLTTIAMKNELEMMKAIEIGRKNRHVGETMMNRDSSRSHCIFCIKSKL